MVYKSVVAKIAFIITAVILIYSCSAVKRVPAGERLLIENKVVVDSAAPQNDRVINLLSQQPNTALLGIPLRLHIYNLARPNRDSVFLKWKANNPEKYARRVKWLSKKQTYRLARNQSDFNKWLKRTGEAPVLVDEALTNKSEERLAAWYKNLGWFNAKVSHTINDSTRSKRASVTYYVKKGRPYIVDSLSSKISSPQVDSIYSILKKDNILKSGEKYDIAAVNAERARLYREFRNRGVFRMEKEYIKFEGDTVNTNHKANITLIIKDRNIPVADSTITAPFKVYKISQVNIKPDFQDALVRNYADTTSYNTYNILRFNKPKYNNQVLADAVFFKPGDTYRDLDRDRTYKRITELNSFLYPTIEYKEDPADSSGHSLIANLLLTSKKKMKLQFLPEATRSNIQSFGIGLNASFFIRNLFKGSELLNINFRGNVGASANAANGDTRFFDLQEFGADANLQFPRIFIPFNTDKIIPKYMSPSSNLSLGFFSQTNIGLDKQSVNSALVYNWRQTAIKSSTVELIKAQYVRNLDPSDFFNVYRSSYGTLNDIASDINLTDPTYVNTDNDLTVPNGTNQFINDALNGTIPVDGDQEVLIRNIRERRDRLVQDNLIISSSYAWQRNNRKGIYDEDFSSIRLRIEVAGNVLDALASAVNADVNENGKRRVFGVEYTQYVKPEIAYIKHWQYRNSHVLAIRAQGGVAIPYGNSDNIPFIRSFFAGGPNDNRAWQAYELGPGSTGGLNDFNEANMKLAFNAEYRFPIVGAFKGALFADLGNIWNVLDNEDAPGAQFNGIKDLEFLALGTGIGIRYDFEFFVLRFDVGFKTYNPALDDGDRWFRDVNFGSSVLNVGINYPF